VVAVLGQFRVGRFQGIPQGTPFAAQLGRRKSRRKKAQDSGVRTVQVYVKGPGAGREAALRSLQAAGFTITVIQDFTRFRTTGAGRQNGRRV